VIEGNAQQASDAAGGNLRYSITVSKFQNKSGWSGRWSVGDGFGAILTDALQQSGRFLVLGEKDMRRESMREQDLVASGRTAGGKKAPKMGRLTPAQLLVKGVITHVQRDTGGKRGGISFKGITLGRSGGKAEVNITMYLVDGETGQVKASTKVVGEAGRSSMRFGYHGSQLGGLRGNLAGFEKDNLGKACEHAVEQGVGFLTQQLEKIRWEGTVVLAGKDKIILNRGTREGVAPGMQFEVGGVEEIVDPDTGEVLDREMTVAGKVEVTRVKEKLSYAKALSGGDKIAKGMTIYPVK
jgi:curli biogenesis system outer membrane secretion channel CsgG